MNCLPPHLHLAVGAEVNEMIGVVIFFFFLFFFYLDDGRHLSRKNKGRGG